VISSYLCTIVIQLGKFELLIIKIRKYTAEYLGVCGKMKTKTNLRMCVLYITILHMCMIN